MKNVKDSQPTADPSQQLLEKASAAFERDCQQACRRLRVHIALNVFGVGTLIPNNLADEYPDHDASAQSQRGDASYRPAMTLFADSASAAHGSAIGASEYPLH
ncbi:hypothetical protein HU727_003030 [Pseudomonas sp. SWRI153]|uniref:Uncharacterized protein n=1 Tax=Pseudomonas khorasanensis TaxID=2745508 RepID=A0A923JCN8_9PSED|nr:hypothetical protein [Pseudomonas khorasanensis]MBV4484561.1 hypothetical protein [Pseudomonas khorasanensis]